MLCSPRSCRGSSGCRPAGAEAYTQAVALHRDIDPSEPVRLGPVGSLAGTHEEHRRTRSGVLAVGTLACPVCDAPIAPPVSGPLAPADRLGCGFCDHAAHVRDFLSLAVPSRPARVVVRVVERARV